LESAGCRIDRAEAPSTGRTRDDYRQFTRGLERVSAPGKNNRTRNLARGAFFTQVTQDAHEFFFGLFVDNIVGAQLLTAVHPHIERAIGSKTEAALRIIEREAAHPKVRYDCTCGGGVCLIENQVKIAEISLAQSHPCAKASKTLRSHSQSRVIAIETQQIGASFLQHPFGMAPGANGRVNDQDWLASADEPYHLISHHRHMLTARRAEACFPVEVHP
jgi:hypothetical protein